MGLYLIMLLLCSMMMAIWSCNLPVMTSSLSFKICANQLPLTTSACLHCGTGNFWVPDMQYTSCGNPGCCLQLSTYLSPPRPSIAPAAGWKWQRALEGPQRHAAQPNVLGLPVPNLMHVSSTPFERCGLWGCGNHSLQP